MIFDKACGIVERHFPRYMSLFNDAKIFVFPFAPHVLLKERQREVTQEMLDNFTLPFPVTAVEDNASLIILEDLDDKAVGSNHPRRFLEVYTLEAQEGSFNDTPDTEATMQSLKKAFPFGTVFFTEGRMLNVIDVGIGQCAIDVKVTGLYASNKEEIIISCEDDIPDKLIETSGRNVTTAFEELLLLNTPKRFVVETLPVKMPSKNKKKLRTHQRPQYTLLTISETLSKIGRGQHAQHGTHASPSAHFRRRHLRRLTQESGFKEDRMIVVDATWVGPFEKMVKNKIYKVRLDI